MKVEICLPVTIVINIVKMPLFITVLNIVKLPLFIKKRPLD